MRRVALTLALIVALVTRAYGGMYSAGPSNTTTGSTLALTAPQSGISGHVWVGLLWGSGLSGLAVPGGWTIQHGRLCNGGDNDRCGAVISHVCSNGDSGPSLTVSSSGNGTGGILYDFGDDTAFGSLSSGSSNSSVTFSPSTISVSNESDAVIFCGGAGFTPGGITNPFLNLNGGISGVFASAQSWVGRVPAGTFTPTVTSLGSNAGCFAFILTPATTPTFAYMKQLKQTNCNGSTSCSVNAPESSPPSSEAIWAYGATTQGSHITTPFTTIPSGFITVSTGFTGTNAFTNSAIFCKNSTGSEPGTYTFGTSQAGGSISGNMEMWSVENSTCPAASSGAFTSGSSGTSTTGTLTTTKANSLVVGEHSWTSGQGVQSIATGQFPLYTDDLNHANAMVAVPTSGNTSAAMTATSGSQNWVTSIGEVKFQAASTGGGGQGQGQGQGQGSRGNIHPPHGGGRAGSGSAWRPRWAGGY